MNAVQRLYDALGRLMTYPTATSGRLSTSEAACGYDHVAECLGALGVQHPDASRLMRQFAERIAPLTIEELQELFTRTFDLNPVCSLEVGWHLFGENYSRGEFLVEMRQTLRRLGLPESTELPDHLSQVLPAVARLTPHEADRFTTQHLLPALDKMLAGLRGKDCPYEDVLEAIRAVVLSPYGAVGWAEPTIAESAEPTIAEHDSQPADARWAQPTLPEVTHG